MKLKHRDPNHPEVVKRVLQVIKALSAEETLEMLSWRPEGVEETWMMEELTKSKKYRKAIPYPPNSRP